MKEYFKTFANRESFVQAMKVGAVGVFNTAGTFVIFNAMRLAGLSVFVAITVAYIVTTFLSYLINRRWTFALVDGHVSGRETAAFFGVNIVAYLASVSMVWLADQLFGPLNRIGENVALLVAAMILILPKLASYRDLVFGRALREKTDSGSGVPLERGTPRASALPQILPDLPHAAESAWDSLDQAGFGVAEFDD